LVDILELGSFLLMLYAGVIALYVARRASRVSLHLFLLSLLLSMMILLHGFHHLFAFLQNSMLEQLFDFGASLSALALALAYAYIWRRY
jgi:NhaP-type Na+/H+ or K+/H+ antiporter